MWAGIFEASLRFIIRIELRSPEAWINNDQIYNTIIASYAFIIIFFIVIPFVIGNWLTPIIIGAPDIAFQRKNNIRFLLEYNSYNVQNDQRFLLCRDQWGVTVIDKFLGMYLSRYFHLQLILHSTVRHDFQTHGCKLSLFCSQNEKCNGDVSGDPGGHFVEAFPQNGSHHFHVLFIFGYFFKDLYPVNYRLLTPCLGNIFFFILHP